MTTEPTAGIPKPPGNIKSIQPAEPAPIPEYAMTTEELRREVWRYKAIAKHTIPEEHHYIVQGPDPETINHQARTLAELLARIN